jgi:hypothetical protein
LLREYYLAGNDENYCSQNKASHRGARGC